MSPYAVRRGLKCLCRFFSRFFSRVAVRSTAWIEIIIIYNAGNFTKSPYAVRRGLKSKCRLALTLPTPSPYAVRRGLK